MLGKMNHPVMNQTRPTDGALNHQSGLPRETPQEIQDLAPPIHLIQRTSEGPVLMCQVLFWDKELLGFLSKASLAN